MLAATVLAVGASLSLGGCGFTPLYAAPGVASKLAAIDVPARVEPQRRRAERRARSLAAAIESLKQPAAALDQMPTEPIPIAGWSVVGPFPKDQGPPFSVNQPIKTSAKFKNKKGSPAAWTPAKPIDARGKVDLGAVFSREDNQSAFAYAEIVRPEPGLAKFSVGSDDTLTVWVRGKQVYQFNNHRSYDPNQDSFEVLLPPTL